MIGGNDYHNRWDSDISDIPLSGDAVLRTNQRLEQERLQRAMPLLREYGNHYSEFVSNEYAVVRQLSDTVRTWRCYDAALHTALHDQSLTYCEGFCFFSTGPNASPRTGVLVLAHGWAIDKHGKIVDMTMPASARKLCLYIGIPFKLQYVVSELEATGYVGLLDGRLRGSRGGVYYDHEGAWLQR